MKEQRVETRILDPGSISESELTYVVIGARLENKWIFVRHRDRSTWEMPAGHIDAGESADQAAVRELQEEAGVIRSSMEHYLDYSVTVCGRTEYGRLYGAVVSEIESRLEHETEEIVLLDQIPSNLTYPEVQTLLYKHLNDHFFLSG